MGFMEEQPLLGGSSADLLPYNSCFYMLFFPLVRRRIQKLCVIIYLGGHSWNIFIFGLGLAFNNKLLNVKSYIAFHCILNFHPNNLFSKVTGSLNALNFLQYDDTVTSIDRL